MRFIDLEDGDIVLDVGSGKLLVISHIVNIYDGEAYAFFHNGEGEFIEAHVSEFYDGHYKFVKRPEIFS